MSGWMSGSGEVGIGVNESMNESGKMSGGSVEVYYVK